MKHRLPQATVNAILEARRKGKSCDEIARTHGISHGTVYNVTKEAGLVRKRAIRPIPADRHAGVVKAFRLGWSVDQIAKHLGRQAAAVRMVLKSAGIAPVRDGRNLGPKASWKPKR